MSFGMKHAVSAALVWLLSNAYGSRDAPLLQEPDVQDLFHPSGADALHVLLLTLDNGPGGQSAMSAWSDYVSSADNRDLAVRVLCPTPDHEAAVREAAHLEPLLIDPSTSWEHALELLVSEHREATIFGLFPQGNLPYPGLSDAVRLLSSAIVSIDIPTIIIPRSRSVDGVWLPDTFVAQVWANRAALTSSTTSTLPAMQDKTISNLHLLQVLPRLCRDAALVDGTDIIRSVFDAYDLENIIFAEDKEGNKVYIGAVQLGLRNSDDKTDAAIFRATWPPTYVLDTVAGDSGLVIVSNVNCGYLDMATNFLRSVQMSSSANVLFVAMDEVAFDFMDAWVPGHTVMYPQEDGISRDHASKAGTFGDKAFAAEVLVRPSILMHILAQNYTALWTDSDIVWLGDPLPLLPDPTDANAADIMLQHDGPKRTCTCFMYMRPTPMAMQLLHVWKHHMIDIHAKMNQPPFAKPLLQMEEAGLKVAYIPDEAMPHGAGFFNNEPVEDYARRFKPNARIVHNNCIKGHDAKKERFEKYHLWHLGDTTFPSCE